MRLGEKQELFARLLPFMFFRALQLGYQIRPKELLRTKEQAKLNAANGTGIANSLHCDGLAIDIVLFKDGQPCWGSGEYTELGEFWESLHELASNGRDFNDGGHFSIRDGGRR